MRQLDLSKVEFPEKFRRGCLRLLPPKRLRRGCPGPVRGNGLVTPFSKQYSEGRRPPNHSDVIGPHLHRPQAKRSLTQLQSRHVVLFAASPLPTHPSPGSSPARAALPEELHLPQSRSIYPSSAPVGGGGGAGARDGAGPPESSYSCHLEKTRA